MGNLQERKAFFVKLPLELGWKYPNSRTLLFHNEGIIQKKLFFFNFNGNMSEKFSNYNSLNNMLITFWNNIWHFIFCIYFFQDRQSIFSEMATELFVKFSGTLEITWYNPQQSLKCHFFTTYMLRKILISFSLCFLKLFLFILRSIFFFHVCRHHEGTMPEY